MWYYDFLKSDLEHDLEVDNDEAAQKWNNRLRQLPYKGF